MKNEKLNYQQGDNELLNGYVNADKAKQLLGIGTTSLYYLRKKRELSYSKINRKIFYELNSINALLEKSKVESTN